MRGVAPRGAIRVMIADDHSVFRIGIRQLLEEQAEMEVVAEARAGDEAVVKAREHRPHVVLMDLRMPEMNGLAAARQIRMELPDTRILIVTAVDDDERVFEAIRAGASGYIVKDEEPQKMVEAVRDTFAGAAYFPPPIAKRVLDRIMLRGPAGSRRAITEREKGILRMVSQGKTSREIAEALGMRERTVNSSLDAICRKLQVRGRVQAMLYAVGRGIIRLHPEESD